MPDTPRPAPRGKELADKLVAEGKLTLRRGPDPLAALREQARPTSAQRQQLLGPCIDVVGTRITDTISDRAFNKGYEAGVKAGKAGVSELLNKILSDEDMSRLNGMGGLSEDTLADIRREREVKP